MSDIGIMNDLWIYAVWAAILVMGTGVIAVVAYRHMKKKRGI